MGLGLHLDIWRLQSCAQGSEFSHKAWAAREGRERQGGEGGRREERKKKEVRRNGGERGEAFARQLHQGPYPHRPDRHFYKKKPGNLLLPSAT